MGEASERLSVIPMSVIDADGHLCEPAAPVGGQPPAAMRDRGIRLRWNEATGYDECLVEDRMATDRGSSAWATRANRSPTSVGAGTTRTSTRPGFDPRERVKVLDAEGIDVSVMYPGLGLKLGAIQDPDLAVACCAVYNDWLAEWCARAPDRLVGVGRAPDAGSERAAEEARRIAALGLKAGFARPNAYNDRHFHHPRVHAGVGGARARPASRSRSIPRASPTCRARHAPRTPHGAGHAPRGDPADRSAADALEPRVRRRARTVPRAEGDRARVRRRVDRALDGPDGRVPRELRVGHARAVAHAARVLPTAMLDLVRSRRTHRARARGRSPARTASSGRPTSRTATRSIPGWSTNCASTPRAWIPTRVPGCSGATRCAMYALEDAPARS